MWQGKSRRGGPQPLARAPPSKMSLGLRERSHRDPLTTWLGLQRDLALPPGLLWGSPWAAPGVPTPPAPQAGSAPEPLLGTEQGEHRFGTSPCPPAPSPSRYE